MLRLSIALLALVVHAQDRDPLVAAGSDDPVVLARVVDRIGDDAVLARLAEDAAIDARLAAVHASPAMRAPERALEALAPIAGGRDPDLAPAAARAILAIVSSLDPRGLDAREVMRGELAPARVAIQRVADDETARADVRRVAAIAVEVLSHLGVPAEA